MMTTTRLPSTLGAPTSQYKIKCNASSILIGGKEFLSATDALEAYLSQYDSQGLHTNQSLYKKTVADLLNTKSALPIAGEHSLETSGQATDTEMRLADQKDYINESLLKMKKSLALKAEVDEALNKSQQLIKQINSDNFPNKTDCPSDVGSLATDVLVSMNPIEGYLDPATTNTVLPAWKSGHVYGYKRPRNRRAKTLNSIQITHDLLGLMNDQPAQHFTAQPSEKAAHVTFQGHIGSPSKPNVSKYDDEVSLLLGESPNITRLPTEKKLRERSRSVSPSILKREQCLFESGLREKPMPNYYTDFNSLMPKAPSWIDTMNLSDVSDTDWKRRDFTVSKPPPSWVNDINSSDVTSVVSALEPSKKLEFHDLLRPLPVINTQHDSSYNSDLNDTLPPPGLTYKDLVGDTSRLSNTPGNRSVSPTLSDKLSHLKSRTNAALQRYHDRVQDNFSINSHSKCNGFSSEGPRLSNHETEASITGVSPFGKSDTAGISPITEVTGSPSRPKRSKSPDTDIVLDGDRPWEKTISYKAPVCVHNTNKVQADEQANYSGGSQPGSLEALKNMIFKLQQEAVHTDSEDEGSRSKLSERVHKLKAEAASLGIAVDNIGNNGEPITGTIPTLNGYDFQGEPGGQSLEKALVHLDRLKTLVSKNTQGEGDDEKGASGITSLGSYLNKKK